MLDWGNWEIGTWLFDDGERKHLSDYAKKKGFERRVRQTTRDLKKSVQKL